MNITSTEVTTSIFRNTSNINSSYIPCDPLKFSNYTGYSTRIDSYAISTGYLDGDSLLDIVVVNRNDTIISIYYGFGNGTLENVIVVNDRDDSITILYDYYNLSFSYSETYPVGNNVTAVSIADFNNDSYPDFVTTDYSDNTISPYINPKNGLVKNKKNFIQVLDHGI
ncbi:unnamed protein product [Adineta steineri]|uniref:VCBS repeat-containing protein n=1 Tax=Adineta steineri TaxID=433720 RepID=A0A819Y9V4_9BILA|nr:unnamed protein product [Adineta steineri]CAF4152951.1 unnamed protein product [Adineta steineri]